MNKTVVILTLDMENLPSSMTTLPFFKLQKSIEYFSLMQQF